MTKKIIELTTISFLLLTNGLYASEHQELTTQKAKEGKPVDEGLKNIHKEDTIKGVTFVNDGESKTVTTLSLAKEKERVTIKFENTSRVPLTCKINRDNKNIYSNSKEPINPKESTAIEFTIEKSMLKKGDKIVISNRRNVVIRRIEVVK